MSLKLNRKSFPMVPKSDYKAGFIMLIEALEKIPIFASTPCTAETIRIFVGIGQLPLLKIHNCDVIDIIS